MQTLDEYFTVNRFYLNIDKINFVAFHTSTKSVTYMHNNISINGVTIVQSTMAKFLGVLIGENLTCAQHIKATASKIDKNVGVIKITHLLPLKH